LPSHIRYLIFKNGYQNKQPFQSSQQMAVGKTSTANEADLHAWEIPTARPISLQIPNVSSNKAEDSQELGVSVGTAAVGCEGLANERAGQFTKLLPQVLNSENPEAVHDVRVCSRRLQQVLVAMFPEQESRATTVIRAIRKARRGLSGWRDCDVVMALLDKRLRRLRDATEQQAWRVVRDYLARRREKEIRRARRRLAKRKLFTLAQKTKDVMKWRQLNSATNVNGADVPPYAIMAGFVKTASSNWLAALTAAAESGNPANAHRFRIKTKELRYCIELAQHLGDEEVPVPLNWLKSLQDRLGQLHDRTQLARIAMEAFSEADLLLTAPRSVSLLLKRLARELLCEATQLKLLLAEVKQSDELSRLETWTASHNEQKYPTATIELPQR
jgi:CHAD domain-containing protein